MAEQLDYLRDGARIYERSFAVIRAEADLSRFSSEEAEIVVRMVHACGCVDITSRIVFGAGLVAAARAALSDGAPILFEEIEAIRPGIAAMDDYGQLRLGSQLHLLAEYALLHIARRMVIEIIESDFSVSDHARVLRQLRKLLEVRGGEVLRLVRMRAHRGVNPIMPLGKRNRRIQLFGAWP